MCGESSRHITQKKLQIIVVNHNFRTSSKNTRENEDRRDQYDKFQFTTGLNDVVWWAINELEEQYMTVYNPKKTVKQDIQS
jgi:hypothetical protein